MANFCRNCGSRLVNGKCVRPGCPDYAGQPEDSGNVKMEPSSFAGPDAAYDHNDSEAPAIEPFEPELPDENPSEFGRPSGAAVQRTGYDNPGDNAGAPGYGYPGDNAGAPGNGYPGDSAGAPGNGYPGDNAGAPGYGYPGDNQFGPAGSQRGRYSSDDLQRKISDAGKKADEAIRGGLDALGESYQKQMARERSITDGTGRGFTGTGDETITGIKLVNGEKMVRTYHCTTYGFFRKKEGYMTVTNKRVIFESMDATSRISNEVTLDSVSGFKNYYGMNISPGLLISAVIFFLFAIGMFQVATQMYRGGIIFVFYALMLIALAAVCGFLAIKRSVVVSVFSSKATGTPISVGEGPRSMIGNGSVYTMVGRPTEDTGTMIREIGAMVQDLQTRGDHAIEDWVV